MMKKFVQISSTRQMIFANNITYLKGMPVFILREAFQYKMHANACLHFENKQAIQAVD